MPEPAHDALEALRARLEETRAHAERLAEEAATARAAAADDGPRDGSGHGSGHGPGSGGDGGSDAPPPPHADLQAIAGLLEALRELVPPELQQQLADVTRQVLLLLRSLIDWWVDRLEDPAAAGSPASSGSADGSASVVEDIPVD